MKVAFHTLGCKVNQYETESIREKFRSAGHTPVKEDDFADVYIINTCTVTALADRKSRQYIRRMKKLNPDAIVLVTGCYVQVSPDDVAAVDGVDIICGTNEKENILSYVENFAVKRDSDADAGNGNDESDKSGKSVERYVLDYSQLSDYQTGGFVTSMESRTRAYIKIEEGCDRFCSYCVIPFARGPVRSRDRKEILKEAEILVTEGFKELILTGINTALYEDLPGLLRDLDDMDGEFRVRLSSLEPTVIKADDVEKILGSKRLCHHLHLSVQSGSDDILKSMNRFYTRGEYLEIVDLIRNFDPYYGLTTDIIAGFPGEKEKDHMDSISIIERAEFCKVHAFGYSKRPGTKAEDMPGQISPPVKKSRVKELIATGDKVAMDFMEKNIGRDEVVLFEEEYKGMMTGYTGNYLKAYSDFDEKLIGRLIRVKIIGTAEDGVRVIPLPTSND